jgi:hypothetical protein
MELPINLIRYIMGKLYPFTVQISTEASIKNNVLNSIEFMCDVFRYYNEGDYSLIDNITFNKAVVFNNRENSGMLELNIVSPNDLSADIYPQVGLDSTKIEVKNTEGIWRINDLWNSIRKGVHNVPIWLNDSANVDKNLNQQVINYQQNDFDKHPLRGMSFDIKLINDKYSNYKFMVYLNQFNQVKSYS